MHYSNTETFSLIIIMISITLFCTVFMYKKILLPIYEVMEEQSRLLYTLMRRTNITYEELYELKHMESSNVNNITQLTSSIRYLTQDMQKIRNTKIMPTPQLSEMIGSTIAEQIKTEIVLSRGMRVPDKSSVRKIIDNTIRTYPHVDEEYISKRCLATIEEAIRNESQ